MAKTVPNPSKPINPKTTKDKTMKPTKPVVTKLTKTTKPAATKPAATKPAATKPAATKPAATKPAKETPKARVDRIVAEAKAKTAEAKAKATRAVKAKQSPANQEPAMSTRQNTPTSTSTQDAENAALLDLGSPATKPAATKAKAAKVSKTKPTGNTFADLLGPKTTDADDLLGPAPKGGRPKGTATKPVSPVRTAFAARFAGGDKLKFLAFRASTSIRSAKEGPCTIEELAERLDVPAESLVPAIEYLSESGTITAKTKGGVTRYSFVPPSLR